MNHYSGQKCIQTKLQTTYGLLLAIIVCTSKPIPRIFFMFSKKNMIRENRVSGTVLIKEIGDEEPCYSTKISIVSFTWNGLAALHKAR